MKYTIAILWIFLTVASAIKASHRHSPQAPPSFIRRASGAVKQWFAGVAVQQRALFEPASQLNYTTESGAASSSYFSVHMAGDNGPLLMQSTHLLDTLAHFVRERIPERVVHARGWGARGHLKITTDFAEKLSVAPVFRKGTKTWAICRFSTVGGARGTPDVARDPRGFACKFKTKQGILDWVFNNTPVFFIRDPLKFSAFIHTQKTHPQTNLRDANMVFDYLWQNPEASLQFLRLFSDLGTPMGARHMNGWSGHTYRLVKDDGSWVYVKVLLETNQGIKNFTAAQVANIGGQTQEWATQDLYDAIARKEYPSWTVKMAVMTPDEGAKYRYNVNDLTKDWIDVQWNEVGVLTLDTNPVNYHDEIEQSHFSPSNMVPGWAPSEDPVLQSRLFSYNDAARYRLGSNYLRLPINCPLNTVANFDRDGAASSFGSFGHQPNYPSSAGTYTLGPRSPLPKVPLAANATIIEYEGKIGDIDYEQPRHFYQKQLSPHDQINLASNFGSALAKVTQPHVVKNTLALFAKIDKKLAADTQHAIEAAKKTPSSLPSSVHV